MSQDYARALAKITVAQIVEVTGFQALQHSAGDALAELLLQYVSEIGSATHAYAELAGRTDCNVNDVVSSNSHKRIIRKWASMSSALRHHCLRLAAAGISGYGHFCRGAHGLC